MPEEDLVVAEEDLVVPDEDSGAPEEDTVAPEEDSVVPEEVFFPEEDVDENKSNLGLSGSYFVVQKLFVWSIDLAGSQRAPSR